MNILKKTVGLSGLLIFLAGVAAQGANTWLSDLDLKQMTTGWGTVRKDKAISGKPMSIAGKKFERGVGTHSASKLRVDLKGQAAAFTAMVGVDDVGETIGTVEFIVEGDGKILWRSGVLRGGQTAVPVNVKLAGVKIMTLQVTNGNDGGSHDHADWADAKIIMAEGAPGPVALPPYETVEIKTKSFSLSFMVGDDHRLYQAPLGGKQDRLQRYEEAYPQAGDGYIWEPALQVVHADGNTSTRLEYQGVKRGALGELSLPGETHGALGERTLPGERTQPGEEVVRIDLKDPAYPLQVSLFFRIHGERDVIEQWTEIRHTESKPIILQRMDSASILLAPENVYLTQFHGDWADEMNPVTELLTPGTKVLDSKIGVRAHQFRNPSFMVSLDGPATETSGHVLAGSLAWSGSFRCTFDHFGKALRMLSGINPFASEYHLKAGETFVTPKMIWAWSDTGFGDMSRKLHAWARDYGVRDGHEPRQVLLNNWEATGFDFDFDRIAGLYEPARQLGVELFLLDDGWFGNKYPRINDQAGLGDWEPNRKRLPNGVAPLAKAALDKGLRFGIWIEPEMVNPKSELFDKHPDWAIRQPKRELDFHRNQLTLDLTRPAVQDFEWNVIKGVFDVPGVSYVKWDANRYLTQPGSSWLAPDRQSHLWIDYVHGLYQLMDRTMKTYPKTELMLCSGGGGRVDYGALRYFHEFWPSDNTDPVRRVSMQWDYSYFFPSMTLSSHVTHWGKRPMHFACTVAMSARFGMDLDLSKLPEEDKAVCAGAISAYKRVRDVVHLGQLYRIERPHDAARGAINYVSEDKSRAVVFAFQLKNGELPPVKPQGLEPSRKYTVRELNPAPGRAALPQEGKVFTGEELMRDGLTPSCAKELEACAIELGS